MNCKVSVIVPVYNSAKYLEEMVLSLFSQTLEEIEFIFIDDCSTDKSLEILYKLEKKNPEKMIIIKLDVNQGAGGARNIGIKYASGEYIAFADSDDFVKPEMYELMYDKAIENDYDLIECGYFSERRNTEMMLWDKSMEGEVLFEKRVKMIMSCGLLCCKLFKRSLVVDSGIEFITEIPLEDVDFLCRLYCRVQKLGIVEKSLYYYRNNLESFSNKRNGHKLIEVNHKFSREYLNNMKQEYLYDILKPIIEYVVIEIWYDTFKNYVINNDDINVNSLKILDNQLRYHISDYGENMFFVEKAKYDLIKKAFITNYFDCNKAIEILENRI